MSAIVRPNLAELFAQFPPADDLPSYQLIAAAQMPPPYHGLLVHEHHMTVTVEAYHGDLVDVCVLARRHRPPYYSRKIVLALQQTGRIVQFGIVRVNLDFCSEPVRAAIIAEKTPFGRILIEHNVLRRIEPTAFLRIAAGPKQMAWYGREGSGTLYGRLAFIHCDGRRAVELLEIVAPE
jgi:hypothetical protein